jgi:hypothetical protein
MSAETVGLGLFAALNRPGGRICGRLRIDKAFLAYSTCCLIVGGMVAGSLMLATVWYAAPYPGSPPFDWLTFVAVGAARWLILAVMGAVLAAPFVPAATWIGNRLGIESALYYGGLGCVTMAALALFLAGPPRETPFGTAIFAWTIGPPCGAAMGLAWWYLHRRWKARS